MLRNSGAKLWFAGGERYAKETLMRIAALCLAALFAAAVPPAALAQDAGRYVLEKSGDGFVRMDRETGAMSYCTPTAEGLACKPAENGQAAERQGEAPSQGEIARLQEALAALDRRMVRLENSLAQRLESTLPSEEDFQKTLGYMERFLRSFMGVVKDLERQDPPPPAADPNRT
jgi:hypothetical protein